MGRGIHADVQWPTVTQLPDGRWRVDTGRRLEKRKRWTYATEKEAQKHAAELRGEHQVDGRYVLTEEEKSEFLHCKTLLKGTAFTPLDCVQHWLKWNDFNVKCELVRDILPQLVDLKKRQGHGQRYQDQLNWLLGKFLDRFGDKKASEITSKELEEFLYENKGIKESSRLNLYRAMKVFYGFVLKKKWVAVNPLTEIQEPKPEPTVPAILTPAEAEKVIRATPEDMVVFVALALWCGIRIAELCRLKYSDICLDRHTRTYRVMVPPRSSKTKKARNVAVPLNAEYWIIDRVNAGGNTPILPSKEGGVSYHLRLIYRAAGVKHSQGVLRHSFASYHYEVTHDAERTRARLGHDCPDTMFTHYVQLVSRATINPLDYWKVLPKGESFDSEMHELGKKIDISQPTTECLEFLKLL